MRCMETSQDVLHDLMLVHPTMGLEHAPIREHGAKELWERTDTSSPCNVMLVPPRQSQQCLFAA
eukprot:752247-Amphidinium_carterae.2